MENKKIIVPLIAGSCALITIGSATLIAYELISKNSSSSSSQKEEASEEKPSYRGDKYTHFKLTSQIERDSFLTSIVDKTFDGNKWIKSISETKFQNYMKNNIRTILKKFEDFQDEADKYEIEVNYAIQEDCKVTFDIVWSLPTEKEEDREYYYDQLQISFMS